VGYYDGLIGISRWGLLLYETRARADPWSFLEEPSRVCVAALLGKEGGYCDDVFLRKLGLVPYSVEVDVAFRLTDVCLLCAAAEPAQAASGADLIEQARLSGGALLCRGGVLRRFFHARVRLAPHVRLTNAST
jgi:hypothetical protein